MTLTLYIIILIASFVQIWTSAFSIGYMVAKNKNYKQGYMDCEEDNNV